LYNSKYCLLRFDSCGFKKSLCGLEALSF
jgi:hypothetical protein